jgi:hypothetical protein
MRHADIRTTMRYGETLTAPMREAHSKGSPDGFAGRRWSVELDRFAENCCVELISISSESRLTGLFSPAGDAENDCYGDP